MQNLSVNPHLGLKAQAQRQQNLANQYQAANYHEAHDDQPRKGGWVRKAVVATLIAGAIATANPHSTVAETNAPDQVTTNHGAVCADGGGRGVQLVARNQC